MQPQSNLTDGNVHPQNPPGREHFLGFDGLRALAVSFVLLGHLVQFPLPASLPRSLAVFIGTGAGSGVDIFFVLSGFLITTILLKDKGKPAALRVFWIRRFLRIFPAYYFLLLVLLLLYPTPAIPWCATYLSNYYFIFSGTDEPLSPTWSLAVEEHFYFVWPIVALSFAPIRTRRLLLFAILPLSIVSTVALALADAENLKMLTYKGTHARILSLGVGCSIALSRHLDSPRRQKWFIAGLLGSTLALLAAAWLAGERFHPLVTQLRFLVASLSVFLVTLLAPPASIVQRVLEWKPVANLGRISYGVYLYHMPVYFFVEHYAQSFTPTYTTFVVASAIRIAVTLLVAKLSYTFIEEPALRLKDRWSLALQSSRVSRAPALAFTASNESQQKPEVNRHGRKGV